MKVFLAIVSCAIVALQANSSPVGRLKRATRVSAGISVRVPGGFLQSKEFRWNVQDDLREISPDGAPLPVEDSRAEAIHDIEEDIQPGGRIPPPSEAEEDIELGNFVYSKEKVDYEDYIQATSPMEDYIGSPAERESTEGPLAALIDEATADLEATNDKENLPFEQPKAEKVHLNIAAEEAVESSVPIVAETETVAELAPSLPEPERPLALPPIIETETESEVAPPAPLVEPIAESAPLEETEEDIQRKKRDAELESQDLWEFQQESRDHFNLFRDRVGMPEVTLDDELSAGAQAWADHMLAMKSTELSDCDDCAYIETFAHKTILSSRRDVPTGGAAADWVITRWFHRAADNAEDPYSKALLRREGISKMGIGAAYSRVGDRKELFVVARFE